MRTLLSRIVLSVGLLFGVAGAASASTSITFDLDTGNSAISGFTGPYATVTVNWTNTTHATIIFNRLTQGSVQYFLAAQGAAAVNVAGAFSLGTISCSPSLTCGPDTGAGAGTEDGFGKFNLTIDSFDGFTSKNTQISFDITATGGNTWADAEHVLTANKNGALAAAHIFVVAPDFPGCTTGTTAACATGYASGSGGGGPPVIIPEPQTLALLGLGLLALGLARRRQVG